MNFNFGDKGTYFLQVLKDHREITFVTLNGFCPLSKKKKQPPPVPKEKYQDGGSTDQNFLHCVSSFDGTSYKNLSDTITRSFISCCFY